jgi:hypothetical protein
LCVQIPLLIDREPIKAQNESKSRYESGGAMTRYRLKTPIAAIYGKPEGGLVRMTLPAGGVLTELPHRSGTLIGMIGVYWEGRHYSVHLKNLLKNAQRVSIA